MLASDIKPAGQVSQEPGLADVDLSRYQEDIDAGKVLVVVESFYEGQALQVSVNDIKNSIPGGPSGSSQHNSLEGQGEEAASQVQAIDGRTGHTVKGTASEAEAEAMADLEAKQMAEPSQRDVSTVNAETAHRGFTN